jgi:hypothetical protein
MKLAGLVRSIIDREMTATRTEAWCNENSNISSYMAEDPVIQNQPIKHGIASEHLLVLRFH